MNFEDFLHWNNINLKFENIPSHIKGFARYNGLEYLVVINSRCCNDQQISTFTHELIHIFEGHFYCLNGYEEKCEKEVQRIIKELRVNYII